MQKEKREGVEEIVISNPEASLEQEGLNYKSAELQSIIDNFTRAENFRDIHRYVLDLLQDAASFRYATVPNGLFFKVRNASKSDEDLKNIISRMEKALILADKKIHAKSLSPSDNKILRLAMDYACQTLTERIKALPTNDRLLPLLLHSELTKFISKRVLSS